VKEEEDGWKSDLYYCSLNNSTLPQICILHSETKALQPARPTSFEDKLTWHY
jgi:hypothetical protein